MNICLSTKSKTISEILKVVLDDLYSKIEPEALEKYEFSGIISENGEQINLYKSDGTELSREQILSVMIYVLLRDSSIRTFVVPDTISEYTETAILRLGGNVIRVSGGDSEIMEKIISSGSSEQMLMQFDGIYAAVKILDFLNRYDISFDSLTMHLPQIFKAEAEVACGDEKTNGKYNKIFNLFKTKLITNKPLSNLKFQISITVFLIYHFILINLFQYKTKL